MVRPGGAEMLEQIVAHEDTFAIAAVFGIGAAGLGALSGATSGQ